MIAVAERGELRFSPGALLVFAAAVLQGLSFIVQRPTVRTFGPAAVTGVAVWLGTALLAIPFGGEAMRELRHAKAASIVAVGYTGFVSSVFGLVCWAYVMDRLPASTASPFLMAVPVVATAVSLGLIGELPKASTLLGGGMTLAGIIIGLGYFRRRAPIAVTPVAAECREGSRP